jgi:hypothetical protein
MEIWGGSQKEPGAARGSQEEPRGARGSQGQPGGGRGSQERQEEPGEPGAARNTQIAWWSRKPSDVDS